MGWRQTITTGMVLGFLLCSNATLADVIVAFPSAGTLHLFNPQGYQQTGQVILSPPGVSQGVSDTVIPYSLNANQVSAVTIPSAGRVAIIPDTDDTGYKGPDPIVTADPALPLFAPPELANTNWFPGVTTGTAGQPGRGWVSSF